MILRHSLALSVFTFVENKGEKDMVLLTIYKNTNEETGNKTPQKTIDSLEESVEKAIQIGQSCQQYYEIFDMCTGRTIDWNEVNYKGEDEWYYDETEYIWKKREESEPVMELPSPVLDWLDYVRCHPESIMR
jgi:hypothetical protein